MHSSVTHILLKINRTAMAIKLPEDRTKRLGDNLRWQHGWISPADKISGPITIDQIFTRTVSSSSASVMFITMK